MKVWGHIVFFPRAVGMLAIRAYQKTISPDHGLFKAMFPYGYCKFSPSCSQYGYEALEKNGLLLGSLQALWRILRCNPFSRGGEDQVKKLKINFK